MLASLHQELSRLCCNAQATKHVVAPLGPSNLTEQLSRPLRKRVDVVKQDNSTRGHMLGPIREVPCNTLVRVIPVNVKDVDWCGPKLGSLSKVRLNKGHHVGQAKRFDVYRSGGNTVRPEVDAVDVPNSRGGERGGGKPVVNSEINDHARHPIPHNPLREVVQPSPGRRNLNKIHRTILPINGAARNRKLWLC